MRLSEYLIEAVARRRSGNYDRFKKLTMDDLKPGMKVRIKSLEECNIEKYNSHYAIVGSLAILPDMYEWFDKIVTVERLNAPKGYKPAVYVEENDFAWPVEIFELI